MTRPYNFWVLSSALCVQYTELSTQNPEFKPLAATPMASKEEWVYPKSFPTANFQPTQMVLTKYFKILHGNFR